MLLKNILGTIVFFIIISIQCSQKSDSQRDHLVDNVNVVKNKITSSGGHELFECEVRGLFNKIVSMDSNYHTFSRRELKGFEMIKTFGDVFILSKHDRFDQPFVKIRFGGHFTTGWIFIFHPDSIAKPPVDYFNINDYIFVSIEGDANIIR